VITTHEKRIVYLVSASDEKERQRVAKRSMEELARSLLRHLWRDMAQGAALLAAFLEGREVDD